MALRPSASPPAVHQLKISSFLAAPACSPTPLVSTSTAAMVTAATTPVVQRPRILIAQLLSIWLSERDCCENTPEDGVTSLRGTLGDVEATLLRPPEGLLQSMRRTSQHATSRRRVRGSLRPRAGIPGRGAGPRQPDRRAHRLQRGTGPPCGGGAIRDDRCRPKWIGPRPPVLDGLRRCRGIPGSI